MLLSVLVPVFNESTTVGTVITAVLQTSFPPGVVIELLVVDDGSTDATWAALTQIQDPRLVCLRHGWNKGKGAAVKTAAAAAHGDYMVIFDADLEYSTVDLARAVEPVVAGEAEVVYGTRTFAGATAHSFWYVLGNRGTTFLANALFNCWMADLHTCIKLLPLPLFRTMSLQEDRFGLDTELTARLLATGHRPYEVPVRYKARSHAAGKKITWRDGVRAVRILLRVRWQSRAGIRSGLRRSLARRARVK